MNRPHRLFVALLALAGLLLAAPSATLGQQQRQAIRDIKPRQITVGFDRLIVRQTDEGLLEVDYAIERESWRRLQNRRIDVSFEVSVPMEVTYRFWAYNFFRAVWPITARTDTLLFPEWVEVSQFDRVGLCLFGASPGDRPDYGTGWRCESTFWSFVRSDWSVQLSAGETLRLRRQERPVPFFYLYWVGPLGPFYIPGPDDVSLFFD
jgi:hypothetical protein